MLRHLRVLPLVLAMMPTMSFGKTVVECAVPDTMIRSFPGAVAAEHGVDWRHIAHGQSTLRLVREDGSVDLVLVDSAGSRYSARAGAGDLALTEGKGGAILHVIVNNDGALSHFLFEQQDRSAGTLFWSGVDMAGSPVPASASTVCQFL